MRVLLLQSVCGDLRLLADAGAGDAEPSPSVTYPGTGFLRAAGCSAEFASGWTGGLATLQSHYTTVRRLLEASWGECHRIQASRHSRATPPVSPNRLALLLLVTARTSVSNKLPR